MGQLFLRLMLLLVVPLVASSLVLAVTGLGDLRKVGRMGLRCLGLALVFSACSVRHRHAPGGDPATRRAPRSAGGRADAAELRRGGGEARRRRALAGAGQGARS